MWDLDLSRRTTTLVLDRAESLRQPRRGVIFTLSFAIAMLGMCVNKLTPTTVALALRIALSGIGLVALQNYLVYLVQDSLHIPLACLASVTYEAFLAANASGAVFSILGGAVSDWLDRRKLLYGEGAALLSVGLLVQASSVTVHCFLGGCVIAGIGFGLLNGLTWSLAARTSADPARSGRDMEMVSVPLTLPSIVVPCLATTIGSLAAKAGQSYSALYVACAMATARQFWLFSVCAPSAEHTRTAIARTWRNRQSYAGCQYEHHSP
jgi:hypothetical protein